MRKSERENVKIASMDPKIVLKWKYEFENIANNY